MFHTCFSYQVSFHLQRHLVGILGKGLHPRPCLRVLDQADKETAWEMSSRGRIGCPIQTYSQMYLFGHLDDGPTLDSEVKLCTLLKHRRTLRKVNSRRAMFPFAFGHPTPRPRLNSSFIFTSFWLLVIHFLSIQKWKTVYLALCSEEAWVENAVFLT